MNTTYPGMSSVYVMNRHKDILTFATFADGFPFGRGHAGWNLFIGTTWMSFPLPL